LEFNSTLAQYDYIKPLEVIV